MQPDEVASAQSSAEQQLSGVGQARKASGKGTGTSSQPSPAPHKLKRDPIVKENADGKQPGRSGKATRSPSRRRSTKSSLDTRKMGTARSRSPVFGRSERRRIPSAEKETPRTQMTPPQRIIQAGADTKRTSVAAAVEPTGRAGQPAANAAGAEGFRSGLRPTSAAGRGPNHSPIAEASARSPTLTGYPASSTADKRSGGTFLVSVGPVSRLEVMVAASAFAVLMVVAVLGIIKIAWPRLPAVSSVCYTHACLAYSARLLSSVNKSVNPCQDFTRFVCDGWQREHYLDVWEDQFRSILNRLDSYLKLIKWRVAGQNEEQRAAAVYQSCDSVLRGHSDEFPAVKAALADAGIVWPRPSVRADVLHTLLYCSLRLGWDTLLHFVVDETEEVVVSPGRSLYFVLFRHLSMKMASEEAYFGVLKSSFSPGDGPSVTYKGMLAMAGPALTELSAVYYEMYDERRDAADWFLNAPGARLTETRWREALRAINLSLPNGLRLSTTQREFLQTVLSIWETNGEDAFHLFVSWCTVQVAALYANKPLIMNYYDNHVDTALVRHKAFCVSRAVFFSRQATFEEYNADVLQGNAASVAREITLSVRVAFYDRLSKWPHYDENVTVVWRWTSLETAFRSFEKSDVHEPGAAGVPDMTESFVGNWHNSVFVKNPGPVEKIVQSLSQLRFYILLWGEGDFQLMPYSLSFPLFNIELPAAINYGGLGGEVADAMGELFLDAYHDLNVSQVLTECMSPGGGVENVIPYASSVSGYGALVDAFKRNSPPMSPAIPSFGEYTDLQLLFIASCYTLCLGSAKRNHPQCNVIVQHIPEFSEAFNCAAGEPMNRSYQCQLL